MCWVSASVIFNERSPGYVHLGFVGNLLKGDYKIGILHCTTAAVDSAVRAGAVMEFCPSPRCPPAPWGSVAPPLETESARASPVPFCLQMISTPVSPGTHFSFDACLSRASCLLRALFTLKVFRHCHWSIQHWVMYPQEITFLMLHVARCDD